MPAATIKKSNKNKKRVKKTRTFMDEKGYFVTQEYSSDEEVEEQVAKP